MASITSSVTMIVPSPYSAESRSGGRYFVSRVSERLDCSDLRIGKGGVKSSAHTGLSEPRKRIGTRRICTGWSTM